VCAQASVRTDIFWSISVFAHDIKPNCQNAKGVRSGLFAEACFRKMLNSYLCWPNQVIKSQKIFALIVKKSMDLGENNCLMFSFRSEI
jgi:hypothetical protein